MPLGQSIEQWPSRSHIRYAAVVDHDGELVERLMTSEVDWEAGAALAVSLLKLAGQLGNATSVGPASTAVIEGRHGTTIIADFPGSLILVIIAYSDRDIGQLLFDVRHHRHQFAGAA